MFKLLMLLVLISCSSGKVTTNTDVIKASLINVTKFTNFTDKEIVKAKKYIPLMESVVKSQCFEDFMVARKMIKTDGLSNKEVVAKLRGTTVDIELIAYYKRFSYVAGYTEPGAKWIKINRKYHTGASLCSEASNLYHELSHKIGFGHTNKGTSIRKYSVPYSINDAFKVCCENPVNLK